METSKNTQPELVKNLSIIANKTQKRKELKNRLSLLENIIPNTSEESWKIYIRKEDVNNRQIGVQLTITPSQEEIEYLYEKEKSRITNEIAEIDSYLQKWQFQGDHTKYEMSEDSDITELPF